MPNPGLVFVISKVIDPKVTPDEKYNDFYNKEHLPDVLNHGISKIALRYKNANPDAERSYLAMYPVEDPSIMGSDEAKQFIKDTSKSKTFDGADIHDYIDFKVRHYEKIQTFEGFEQAQTSGKDRGHTLVCVAMAPKDGEDKDFDDWYRLQHLDMLSMCRGYRRTTRYKLLGTMGGGDAPKYLALHEYACAPSELPGDQLKIVTGTEWSKKVISEAKAFDRDVFTLIQAQGDLSEKL